MALPATTRGSHCCAFASSPESSRAWPPSSTVERKGSGASVRPSSSSTTASSAKPRPAPPSDSGKTIPIQPSSAISFQSAREKPTGSLASRSARTRAIGDFSFTKSALVFAISSWSSVRTSSMALPLVRQPEHALRDHVALHLGGAPLDRVAARAQPVARGGELLGVEAGAVPAEPLRAGDPHQQLLPAHV